MDSRRSGATLAPPQWVREVGAIGGWICPSAAIFAAARERHMTSAVNSILAGERSVWIRKDDGQSGGGQGVVAGFWHRNFEESGRRISVLGTGRTIWKRLPGLPVQKQAFRSPKMGARTARGSGMVRRRLCCSGAPKRGVALSVMLTCRAPRGHACPQLGCAERGRVCFL
jgi:hypothetical protein